MPTLELPAVSASKEFLDALFDQGLPFDYARLDATTTHKQKLFCILYP